MQDNICLLLCEVYDLTESCDPETDPSLAVIQLFFIIKTLHGLILIPSIQHVQVFYLVNFHSTFRFNIILIAYFNKRPNGPVLLTCFFLSNYDQRMLHATYLCIYWAPKGATPLFEQI